MQSKRTLWLLFLTMVVESIYILTNIMQNLSVGLMQSGLTETKEHSPHVGLEAECFEGMSVYRWSIECIKLTIVDLNTQMTQT